MRDDDAVMRARERAEEAMRVLPKDPLAAQSLAIEALGLAYQAWDRQAAERAAFGVGASLVTMGKFVQAISYIADLHEELNRRFGPVPMPPPLMNVIGTAYRNLGLYDLAIDYLLRAEAAMRQTPQKIADIGLINNLGLAYKAIGEADRCLRCLSIAMAAFELRGNSLQANRMRGNIGEMLFEQGAREEAFLILHDTLKNTYTLEDEIGRAGVLNCLGKVHTKADRRLEAELAFRESWRIFDRHGLVHNCLEGRISLAEALCDWDRHDEAETILHDALEEADRLDLRDYQVRIRLARARVLERLERWREASESYHGYFDLGADTSKAEGRVVFVDRLIDKQRETALALEREIARQNEELVHSQETIIESLAALAELRDDDTGEHIRRTKRFVGLLAFELSRRGFAGIDRRLAALYAATSPLHDIGKVGIPDSILRKTSPLTDEEFSIMRTHTTIGERVVRMADWASVDSAYARAALEIIGGHHECWDGSGYPRALKGECVPLGGRIMAVVDVYDAFRSKRPYKDAYTHEAAVAFIKSESGRRFDPAIVAVFSEIHGEFERSYLNL